MFLKKIFINIPNVLRFIIEAETAHSPCSTASTSMLVDGDGYTETADSVVEGTIEVGGVRDGDRDGDAAYELVTHPIVTATTVAGTAVRTHAEQLEVKMEDSEHNGFVTVYADHTQTTDLTAGTSTADNDAEMSVSASVSPTPACTDTSTSASTSARTSPAMLTNTSTLVNTITNTITTSTKTTNTSATTTARANAQSITTTTAAVPSADSFHFHFGIPYFTKPASIDKSYNAAENANTAITSFVTRNDTLMAFQLTHKTPEYRKHFNVVSTYSSRPATVYDSKDSDCAYVAVDVCMGNKVKAYSYLSSEKIELAGYPVRVALPVDCTNRYVHQKLREVTQRYLRDDVNTPDTPSTPTTPSMDISNNTDNSAIATANNTASDKDTMPYSLLVTNAYGSMVRRTVPIDDNVFEVPKSGLDMLVVAWPDRFAEVMDEEQLTAVHNLESDRSNPATPKKAGKECVLLNYVHC